MRRILLLLACLYLPFCIGCAVERQYFFNHNPITDTAIAVGSVVGGIFFDPDPTDLSDVRYSDDQPAEIRPL
jgi:hypothetical protein